MSAIGLRPRSVAFLVVASVFGLAAFCWPLIIAPGSAVEHGTDAPWVFGLLLLGVLALVLAEVSEGGMDAKAVAMLGVLSALTAAVRPLGAGTAGIETVFVIMVLGGRVFGPGFGFVLGNTALFASALLTGGVGPWLPFQMLGAAWVGLGAGLLPALRGRWELAMLAVYGTVAALAYGVLLNLSFWPFTLGSGTAFSFVPGDAVVANLARLGRFTLVTSLGWDLNRGLTTALLLFFAGPVLLRALRRAARRAVFAPAPHPALAPAVDQQAIVSRDPVSRRPHRLMITRRRRRSRSAR